MSYLALYRKLRPKTFDDVISQEHIVKILKNQLSQGKVSHAYLFCGVRGTGKTSTAKILAKALNCKNPVSAGPCNECTSCEAIEAGRNLNVIEIDAASNNGVDNIRDLKEEVKYPPSDNGYKVYIIDEVHMLSTGAFNALLKTLEEPPDKVVFILATTDPQKIPATILSRCQRMDFKRITPESMSAAIKEYTSGENVDITDEAINYIVSISDGAMRDALSLLDQCIAYFFGERISEERVMSITGAVDKTVFFNFCSALNNFDGLKCIEIINETIMNGKDISQFISDFINHLRNLLVISVTGGDIAIDSSETVKQRYSDQAKNINHQSLIDYIKEFSNLAGHLRYAANERIMLETLCIKLCNPEAVNNPDNLRKRLEKLEKQLEKGINIHIPSAPLAQPENDDAQLKPSLKPKAVPEDVTNVVNKWDAFVSKTEEPLKSYFKNTFPGFLEDGSLYMVSESDSLSKMIKKKEAEIKELLGKEFGREYNIVFISKAEYNKKHIANYGEEDSIIKHLEDKLNGFYDVK